MIITYQGKRPKVASSAFLAPTAVLIGDVEIGENASIWFGAVLRGDNGAIRIGARSNVQDNAVIHVSEGSSTIIGEDVTIGHCACMEDCVIEDGALIGSNSVVLNGARIGRRCLVAAGSVVPADAQIPAEHLVAGAPAVIKKPLAGKAVAWVDHGGPEYVKLSRSYLSQGLGDPSGHAEEPSSPKSSR
ncbi:MAG TPA: gamma carbonic anhydrase family protein [Candidatus Baltobacteraceae bacterium]|jgi:carbonic anhydrase/acetyltransferase-like protein (isoleucine patch superfamily)|nr:gamma carbonic anhydrase family protein [Candidatus Baltobacteraceae bacterium]